MTFKAKGRTKDLPPVVKESLGPTPRLTSLQTTKTPKQRNVYTLHATNRFWE